MSPGRRPRCLLVFLATILISKTRCSSGELSAFKWAGLGNCGDSLVSFEATSDVLCAISCARSSNCVGFSYDHEIARGQTETSGRCDLHGTVYSPDLSEHIDCFVPLTTSFPQQPTTVLPTSLSAGSTASTTISSASPTTAASSTTTSLPTTSITTAALPTTETTATTSPTTLTTVPSTTTTSTAPAGVIKPTSLTGTNSNPSSSSSSCANNGGIVGVYEKTPGDEYYLLCKPGPNPFQTGNPIRRCNKADLEECYSTCGKNEIYLGFYRKSGKDFGPCAPITSSTPKRNNADCHTVLANTQENPDSSQYLQWMFCGDGDDLSKYYSITDVVLEKAPVGAGKRYVLKQIVCCRIM